MNAVESWAWWRSAWLSVKSEPDESGGARVGRGFPAPASIRRTCQTGVRSPVHHEDAGHGMGLSICRSIIENYHGRIWVTAAPVKGSIFQFVIPTRGLEQFMSGQATSNPVVYVVDDHPDVRDGLKALFESVGLRSETFGSTAEFLKGSRADQPSCLVLDVRLPGLSGLDFQTELSKAQIDTPIIFITGHGDIPMSVKAMKAGAIEFLTKPLREQDLLDAVRLALDADRAQREQNAKTAGLRTRFDELSQREQEVMRLVCSGLMNKQAAAEMGVSEVTVKVHRHNLMRKLGAKSLPELVRMADMLGLPRKS